jgi:hypothetical protein
VPSGSVSTVGPRLTLSNPYSLRKVPMLRSQWAKVPTCSAFKASLFAYFDTRPIGLYKSPNLLGPLGLAVRIFRHSKGLVGSFILFPAKAPPGSVSVCKSTNLLGPYGLAVSIFRRADPPAHGFCLSHRFFGRRNAAGTPSYIDRRRPHRRLSSVPHICLWRVPPNEATLRLEKEQDDRVTGNRREREQRHQQRADVVVEIEEAGPIEAGPDDE